MGKGRATSMPSQGGQLSQDLHPFTNQEALHISSFGIFMEASLIKFLQRHHWLNHCWLILPPALSPPPPHTHTNPALPEEMKNFPSNHWSAWFLWGSAPPFGNLGVFLTHLINITRHLHDSHHLRNSKCFRSFVTEMGMKNK